MDYVIFGAKSIALGTLKAMEELYPEYRMISFVVSKKEGNPSILSGYTVVQIDELEDKDVTILVATPENYHAEIIRNLENNGFVNYICLDSYKEQMLMEKYYKKCQKFSSISELPCGSDSVSICAYVAKFHNDKELQYMPCFPQWTKYIQVGARLTTQRIAEITDDSGMNISDRNCNYCELTALYWVWKNNINCAEYIGFFHYRRFLEITEDDIKRLKYNGIDAILPYPMIYEPSMLIHHTNYIIEKDWDIMLDAIKNIAPEYYKSALEIIKQPYMYNYNMFVAKNSVVDEYCNWLFPILEYIYINSVPAGKKRNDRYIGYIAENLLTIYFIYNKRKLRIYHTKRIMII